ncbi:MAG: SMC-Scp complex subunit ScpB [Eggerthellaceae bacterium]
MFPGLQEEDLAGAIEAMLFISDEPVSTITMAGMLKVDVLAVQNACETLADRLEAQGGIMLQEVAGGWRLSTKPHFHSLLEQYVLSWDTRRLSKAMLEVLAVVAYAQPVTRASIAQVRGVNSDSSLNSLLEKGLVRESGFADSPGNPALYSTTRAFLEKMGLRSLADLPSLDRFAPDDETKALIVERLSATRSGGCPSMTDSDAQLVMGAQDEQVAERLEQAMQGMLADALADSVGVVEKIDFDDLQFEE